jgi:hypothetical protein
MWWFALVHLVRGAVLRHTVKLYDLLNTQVAPHVSHFLGNLVSDWGMRCFAYWSLGWPGTDFGCAMSGWDLLSQLAGSGLALGRTHRTADYPYDRDSLGSAQQVWYPGECDCSDKSKMQCFGSHCISCWQVFVSSDQVVFQRLT